MRKPFAQQKRQLATHDSPNHFALIRETIPFNTFLPFRATSLPILAKKASQAIHLYGMLYIASFSTLKRVEKGH
jgi:hypothetical protein